MRDEILDLNSVFTFGKHKGREMHEVIEDDPDYFHYLQREKVVTVSKELLEAAKDRIYEIEQEEQDEQDEQDGYNL